MKTIGIKLANGKFFPVLQEENSVEKSLELTTVHNNQTKIMVDLYRSTACSMKDAEYIESLQLEGLAAHPEGEAVISFDISIDKNNNLSAKVYDSETGNQNSIAITLVDRPDSATPLTDSDTDIDDETSAEKELAATGVRVLSIQGPGLLATAEAIREAQESEKITNDDEITRTEEEATVEEKPAEEIPAEEAAVKESEPEDIPDDTPSLEDFTLGDPGETFEESEVETSQESAENIEAEPVEESTESVEDTTEPETVAAPSDFEINEENTEPEITIEQNGENMDDLEKKDDDLNNLDLPDLNFDLPEDKEDATPELDTSNMESTFDLDLPDFPEDTNEPEETSAPDFGNLDDFDLPEPEADNSPAAASSGFDFAGLYDDNEITENDSHEVKKSKVPLIICIICAIICILASAFVLFITHRTKDEKNALAESTAITPAPVEEVLATDSEPEPEPEPAPEPEPIPEPEVEEVIVIEKAEEVIPQQPPVVEEKPKNFVYKIKWGDTLWDIADTYYKNPWRYKEIAKYNGIKDPDHIVSGTIIEIPAE